MTMPQVRLRRLPHGAGLLLPAYQSAHAAGLDLPAAVPQDAPVTHAGIAEVDTLEDTARGTGGFGSTGS